MVSVVHMTYSGEGGAGRAARRAHLSSLEAGMNSSLLVGSSPNLSAGDICVTRTESGESEKRILSAWESIQWGYIPGSLVEKTNSLFTVEYPGFDVFNHPLIRRADVVHLHWVTWLVTPVQIRRLLDAGKKVVWTLHDMVPFTGGCHYSHGCKQFEEACGKCPQLDDTYQLVGGSFLDKNLSYGGREHDGLVIVTPSEWLGSTAKLSRVLGEQKIEVVRNSVETNIFRPPANRTALRNAFGFSKSDVVLAFGNYDNAEHRKGGHLLEDALQLFSVALAAAGGDVSKITLLVFGRGSFTDVSPTIDVKVLEVGEISDDYQMADLLGVSDFVVFPSLEDNYPNSLIEARSCGTPSIGFDIGGVSEIIQDRQTGILIAQPTVIELVNAMVEATTQDFDKFRANCRSAALSENGIGVVGNVLRELYQKLVGENELAETESDHKYYARASSLLGGVVLQPDIRPSSSFDSFPVKQFINSQIPNEDSSAPSQVQFQEYENLLERVGTKRGPVRVAVLVGYHSHHSDHSGPVQFLRHLDSSRIHYTLFRMPLGVELAGSDGQRLEKVLKSRCGKALQGNSISLDAELLLACLRGEFDVVHAVDAELQAGMLLALRNHFPELQSVKFVGSLHQPPEILEPLLPCATESYDRLISLCGTQTDFLNSKFPHIKICEIPHGIDIDFFTPKASAGNLDPGPHLVSVGHWLRDYKVAIEAAELIRERIPDLKYTIVCHNFPIDQFLPHWVDLRSGLSDQELLELYRSTKVFYQPLKDATANNAILEALSVGTPVVSTNIGGVSEMVLEGCGLVAPPNDPNALAEMTLKLLLDDQLRHEYGRNARKRAEDLDWRRIAEMFMNVYEGLV